MFDPIQAISMFRKADKHAEHIYTHGGCYRFHLLLRSIFPDAVPYMNSSRDHVVSKIGDRFYDIRGRVPVKREDEYHLMDAGEIKSAAKWSYRARKH